MLSVESNMSRKEKLETNQSNQRQHCTLDSLRLRTIETWRFAALGTTRQINRSFTRPRQNLIPLARPIKLRVSVIPGPNTPVYTLRVMV